MKISDIKYQRVTLEEFKEKSTALKQKLETAKSAAQAVDAYKAFLEFIKGYQTASNLCYVRFTLNTEDKFYADEQAYYDENGALINELALDFEKTLLASKYINELEKIIPPLVFTKMRMEHKSFAPEIIPEVQEENRLQSEYHKLISKSEIEFDGQKMNLSQIVKYREAADRDTRIAAFNAQGKWMKKDSAEFDRLFDELIAVRNRAAQKLGFPDFVDNAYLRQMRIDYGKKEVESFRAAVKSELVPVLAKLQARQAKMLGVDKIRIYDSPILFRNGNPCPIGTPEEIFAAAKKMYHEMSADTKEFIDFMLENDLFDCLARKGKSGGGYCTTLPSYDMPFIFANFNGTSNDIDVLTHEAGHALAAYKSFGMEWPQLESPGMETAEIHSMAMEHIAYKWMNLFFGDRTDDYIFMHLCQGLTFIPYGVTVDHFQHEVYPTAMKVAERNKKWNELVSYYCPNISAEGVEYLEEGTRWQYQLHNYLYPFYYIDYCLAQTVAFQIYMLCEKDFRTGWATYMKLLSAAGTKTFPELIKYCGLKSPFEKETIREMAQYLDKFLEKRKI